MNIAVIIPNWNGAERLQKCLASLLRQTYKKVTIVVVDNNSQDGSAALLEKIAAKHHNITVLRNAKNLGFTGGVNTGIRWALGRNIDAIALLNDDAIADKHWLEELARALARQPDAGIAVGTILHADGKTIDSTGSQLSIWGLPFPVNRGHDPQEVGDAGYVFSASGGASLYRNSTFKAVGLFDDRYFAYHEDDDFSFRAQLSGLKVFYTPKAIVYHGQGETSKAIPGFTVQQHFRNSPLLLAKNLPASLFWLVLPRFFLAYSLFLANAIRNDKAKPALKGWLQSFALVIDAVWHDRRAIQKRRNVSAREIRDMLWPDLPPDQTGIRKLRSMIIRSKA